jgi:hypothetical protein
MNDGMELSPIEKMAIKASQPADGELPEAPKMKVITFRLPFDLLASVDAFASLTGESRNTTIIDLLKAGVHAVVNELDDEGRFYAIRDALLSGE